MALPVFMCAAALPVLFVQLYQMTGWGAVQLDLSGAALAQSSLVQQPQDLHRGISLNTSYLLPPRTEGGAYFAAPPLYLGNRITSYGGVFTYTLTYLTEESQVAGACHLQFVV